MSQDNIRKSGYLEKLPVKGLMKKWNRRWFVLYGTSHEGVVRIEYFDSRETFKNGVGKRTIPMRDGRELCTAASTKLHPYVFQFTSQIGHHVLAADSQPELDEWMDCIKTVCQEDRLRRRRTKGQSMVVASDDDTLPSFNDSGMSYKNRIDSGTYRVTVEENETSIKMALSGTYSLELYPTMLALVAPSGAKIFTLPYKHLKNYGKQSGKFHFETGKNSPIGIGKLLLVTSCSKEVFGVVHNNIKKMRENIQDELGNPKPPPAPPQKPDKYQPTQAMPRPQPVQSVEQPPLPKKISSTNRPTSDVFDSSVAGTYRLSTDLETSTAASKPTTEGLPLYSTVDMSKKKDKKQQKKNDPPKPPQPYSSTTEDPDAAIYTDPYEEDPAYRVPVHGHQSNAGIDNLRASVGLVEMEDNTFGDSFDEDVDPLTEGATNPLNEVNLVDFDGDVHHGQKQSIMSAESIAADLATLDFGFGPGRFGPPEEATAGGGNILDNPENMNFNFDFGGGVGLLPSNDDEGVASGIDDLADFDLGKLDANFFEKLDAIDQQPSW